MKRAKTVALFLIATLVVTVITAYGYEKALNSGKTIVRTEACLVGYDKNQLVNDATVIVAGEVVSSEVQDDFKGFPVTDYRIRVDKVFKGNPEPEVEVRTEGGENAKIKYMPDEQFVSFCIGEEVVLFLTDDKGNRPDKNDFGYYVVGEFQGKLKEENGNLKNDKFTFDKVNFAQELDMIDKENRAKGLKKLSDGPSDGI